VVVCEAAAAVTFSAVVAPWLGAAVAAILGFTVVGWALRRRQRNAAQAVPVAHAPNVTIP
jgi:hypothetical protein